jgi:hypothetical protein
LNKELKRAIKDFRKAFPDVEPVIDQALIMHYNRYGRKQTKKEQKVMLKFSESIKVIMKADLD